MDNFNSDTDMATDVTSLKMEIKHMVYGKTIMEYLTNTSRDIKTRIIKIKRSFRDIKARELKIDFTVSVFYKISNNNKQLLGRSLMIMYMVTVVIKLELTIQNIFKAI